MDKRKIIKGALILFASMVIVLTAFIIKSKNNENDTENER